MSFKETLKKNAFIRNIGKRYNNRKEFKYDKKFFNKNFLDTYEKNGDHSYTLMLLIHNLEKGMCRANPRPFGKEKAADMIAILKGGQDKNGFEYKLACAALKAWKEFYAQKGWLDKLSDDVKDYIDTLSDYGIEAGSKQFYTPEKILAGGRFDEVIVTRRAVRDFEPAPLKQEDIDFALKCFQEAPTACNRQMCKVYKIENQDIRQKLNKLILGVGGLNTDAMTYFIVTYDTAAFSYSGERNQGHLNVGLTSMNFVNGLHARGIGTCFMQWSNKKSEDISMRNALGLPKTERIGIVIGAGYYKNDVPVPCSARKPKEMIYKVI